MTFCGRGEKRPVTIEKSAGTHLVHRFSFASKREIIYKNPMPKSPSFPASRELFRLVREIADQMDLLEAERLSDADLGRFIAFESARTSRWKHGQIAVQDAGRLIALSQALDIDLTVISHVAAGYFTAAEALELLASPNRLVRFLGEQAVLSADKQAMTLIGDGTRFKLIRRSQGHYRRTVKRLGHKDETGDHGEAPTVLLVDNAQATVRSFKNLTGNDSGVNGLVARSGPDALIIAGNRQPQLIIFDLFIGQLDGFSAVKSLVELDATSEADVIATSLSLSQEIVRSAIGAGAREVLQRPLNSRTLSHLINRTRSRG
jgi:CheY-like chemotaxis protein